MRWGARTENRRQRTKNKEQICAIISVVTGSPGHDVSRRLGGCMAKIGRNDPCPCGSGKKYKHCHLPIEEAAEAEQRRLRGAVDTLMPQIIEAARELPEAIPPA